MHPYIPSRFSQVKILVTEASKHFLDRSEAYDSEAHAVFRALDPPVCVLGDADEWGAWNALGDPVLHIQVHTAVVCPSHRSHSIMPKVFQLNQAID